MLGISQALIQQRVELGDQQKSRRTATQLPLGQQRRATPVTALRRLFCIVLVEPGQCRTLQQMPFGTLLEIIFFVMLTMAALTSAISMIEATVAWLNESKGISRVKASWGTGIVLWIVSTLAMLSFNVGADWTLAGKTFFDWLDYLTSRWMMPLGGLGLCLMAGFLLRDEIFRDELRLSRRQHALWLLMVRYVSPLGIVLIFIDALGIMTLDMGAQWPWLLAALAVFVAIGEMLSPRLRRQLAG